MEDLKNKISINVRYYKKKEIKRIAGHNTRKDKVTYLLDEEDRLGDNINIFFDDRKAKAFGNEKNAQEKEEMFNDIFNKLEAKKNSIQREKKSYSKKTENLLLEGVFAFPEALTKEYLKNQKRNNILDGLHKFTKHIKKNYGFEPLQISLHLDEGYKDDVTGEVKHNIHAHLTFFNMDFEKGVMPLRGMKRSDWSRWQDIAAQSMQEAGLDFERGDSKDITNRKHLGRNDFIQATEIAKRECISWEKQRDEAISNCLTEEKRLTNLRDELLEMNSKNDKATEIYKTNFKKIGEIRKELKEVRNLRKEFKAIKNKEEMKKAIIKTIDNFAEDNIVVSKNIISGNESYKIENYDNFVNKLKAIAFNINRVEFQEIDGLKNENKDLQSKLDDKTTLLSEVITERNQERQANKTLEQKNKSLEARINVLEQDNISKTSEITKLEQKHTLELKTLKNDFKPFIRLKNSNIANKVRENIRAKQLKRDIEQEHNFEDITR